MRRDLLLRQRADGVAQRLEHIAVEPERREDEHSRSRLVGNDPTGYLDPVQDRHPNIHQRDVRVQRYGRRERDGRCDGGGVRSGAT